MCLRAIWFNTLDGMYRCKFNQKSLENCGSCLCLVNVLVQFQREYDKYQ